jgi:hypothetical protein
LVVKVPILDENTWRGSKLRKISKYVEENHKRIHT